MVLAHVVQYDDDSPSDTPSRRDSKSDELPPNLGLEDLERKFENVTIDPNEPFTIEFSSSDVELWKQFFEYRKHRREWEKSRETNWNERHPQHIRELFLNWPVLETTRLRIRLVRPDDDQDAFNLLSNPIAMKYYGSAPHKDIEYTRKHYIEVMCMRFKYRDAVSFVITLGDEDKLIGQVSAIQFDPEFKFTEISYIIDPEHWGKGIATEVVERIVQFLFKDMKIHKIRASFYARNVASRRVLEKVGFVQEGHLRDNVLIDGEYEDEYSMAIISANSEN
jgi:[ribosomal protein S5]-alanine N-acetyltransferase